MNLPFDSAISLLEVFPKDMSLKYDNTQYIRLSMSIFCTYKILEIIEMSMYRRII